MKEKFLLIVGLVSGGMSWMLIKTAWLYFVGEMSLVLLPESVSLEKWTTILIAALVGIALICSVMAFYCLKHAWYVITK